MLDAELQHASVTATQSVPIWSGTPELLATWSSRVESSRLFQSSRLVPTLSGKNRYSLAVVWRRSLVPRRPFRVWTCISVDSSTAFAGEVSRVAIVLRCLGLALSISSFRTSPVTLLASLKRQQPTVSTTITTSMHECIIVSSALPWRSRWLKGLDEDQRRCAHVCPIH
jgi:hypothetical protein